MTRGYGEHTSAFEVLGVLADMMRGGRHSRTTVARAWSVSLPTADRWLSELACRVPGVRKRRIGKVTWMEWRATVRVVLSGGGQ